MADLLIAEFFYYGVLSNFSLVSLAEFLLLVKKYIMGAKHIASTIIAITTIAIGLNPVFLGSGSSSDNIILGESFDSDDEFAGIIGSVS